jgi:hypothetical protein
MSLLLMLLLAAVVSSIELHVVAVIDYMLTPLYLCACIVMYRQSMPLVRWAVCFQLWSSLKVVNTSLAVT